MNLRVAFPELGEGERRRIGRESFANFAWNLIDFVRCERWGDEELRQHVGIEGLEHLEVALAEGRGALALTLHLGNFEVGGRRLRLEGIGTDAIGRTMRNELLYGRIVAERSRSGRKSLRSRPRRAQHVARAAQGPRRGGAERPVRKAFARRVRAVPRVRCSTAAGVPRSPCAPVPPSCRCTWCGMPPITT